MSFTAVISDRDSCISDSLDQSDIRAYDDIRTHKVKVDRESVSFIIFFQISWTLGLSNVTRSVI